MDQQHVAGQPRRGGDPLAEVEQHVAGAARIVVAQAGGEDELVGEVHQVVGAVGLRSGLGDVAAHAAATVAGQVVPDHLLGALRDREGVGGLEALQAVAAVHQPGAGGVARGRRIDLGGQAGAAPARVDRHAEAVRVAAEHRQLSGRQALPVLLDVLRGDGEQHGVAGIGVAEKAAGIGAPGIDRQAAIPGRDAAGGVAGLLGADRGQAAAEPGRLLGRDGGQRVAGQQGQGQSQNGALQRDLVRSHARSPCPWRLRSSCRS